MPSELIGPLWNERKRITSVNGDGLEVVNITLPFLVKNKTFFGGVLEALTAPGLPTYGDVYAPIVDGIERERDDGLLVKAINHSQHDNHPQYWRFEIEYSNETFDPARQERDPFAIAPVFMWDKERIKEALETDLDGQAIVNGANVPYQAVETDASVKVVSVERNLPDFDRRFWDDFEDLVNTDEWEVDGQVFAPYRCKVHSITTTGRKFFNATTYWPTKLTVHIKEIKPSRERPWDLWLLNSGTEYYDGATSSLLPFTDAVTGRPLSTPQLLAEDGSYLVSRHGGPLPPGITPNYRQFRVFDYDSFADLTAIFIA